MGTSEAIVFKAHTFSFLSCGEDQHIKYWIGKNKGLYHNLQMEEKRCYPI